jgi:hypothetical protein
MTHRIFMCASCSERVVEPLILNGQPLCETCAEEFQSAKTGQMVGLRQPKIEPVRRRRHDGE